MTALSITLPGQLAAESKRLAERMGISRSEFIRIAVKHEVKRLEKELQLKSMAKSFEVMRSHADYVSESDNLDITLGADLIEDEDDWWR